MILGANLLLGVEDINNCQDLIKNSKLLVTNLEIPLETAIYSLKLAKLNKGKRNATELSRVIIIIIFFSFKIIKI